MAYDPGAASFTSTNMLRLYLGDTNLTYIIFTDNELGAIVTRFTAGSVIKYDVCVGWCLRALAADPDRLWTLKRSIGSGVSVPDLMDIMWARAEAAFSQ